MNSDGSESYGHARSNAYTSNFNFEKKNRFKMLVSFLGRTVQASESLQPKPEKINEEEVQKSFFKIFQIFISIDVHK